MAGRENLTRAQRRELEAELLRERDRLERALKTTAETESWMPAADVWDVQMNAGGVTMDTHTRVRYDAIVEALARFTAGTYGICGSCGQPIPYGRLIVMPETTRCVSCSPRS
ncbi:MAG: TraR/DksA family transcriptional regulator [Gemmatimonadaceae bacterium]